MGIKTLLKFLIGDRETILQLAADPRTPAVGALFVFSAGLAREYDGEYLLAEPWHLLLPFGVSLFLASVLFVSTLVGPRLPDQPQPRPPLGRRYLAFLGLFWWTAPLAWLYAVPFERVLGAAPSVRANLWLLGVVSAWRVLLISRVMTVITGRRWLATFFITMLLAVTVAVVLLYNLTLPLVALMGGVRLSESDELLASVGLTVVVLGFYSWFVWFVGATMGLVSLTGWIVVKPGDAVRRPSWPLPIMATGLFLALLPFTQPEQRRRHLVERELRAGHIAEGLAALEAHPQSQFPPHWDPPPRITQQEEVPPLLEVMETMVERPTQEWVRAIYVEKFERAYLERPQHRWHQEAVFPRVQRILEHLPERPSLQKKYGEQLQYVRRITEANARDPSTQASTP